MVGSNIVLLVDDGLRKAYFADLSVLVDAGMAWLRPPTTGYIANDGSKRGVGSVLKSLAHNGS